MFLNEVNERVLSEFMAHCYEDMQKVCPGLFEKVVRITRATGKYEDLSELKVIAVNVREEVMELPPVLIVYPTASQTDYFPIMINRDQAGGQGNNFTAEEVAYIIELAKGQKFVYEFEEEPVY